MIRTRRELKFYILADRMMNRGLFTYPLSHKLIRLFVSDYIMNYLVALRKMEYFGQRGG